MIKKAAIVTAGVLLVLALMFGSKIVPYAKTAYQKLRDRADDMVSVEFKLDAARTQLERVESDIKGMMHSIAQEQVEIENLEAQLGTQQNELDRQYTHIMKLRDHLDSGDTHFVVHNRQFDNRVVREDLKNRFDNYKIAEATVTKTVEILDVRKQGLQSAKTKLENTIADRHALELEIENLQARKQMLDVAKSASEINLDDSQLARTREMIEDIKTRLDVEEEYLSLTPKYVGSIPMDGQTLDDDSDILEEVDAYFSKDADDIVIK